MTLLSADADRAVRAAVEAFLGGALRPSLEGETLFETKNSRYRMLDGVLFSSNDPSLVGAELVGWLFEMPERSFVQTTWIAGARGVFLDRRRGKNIIVTSSTRVYRVDSSRRRGGSPLDQDAALPPPSFTHGPLTPRLIPPCPPLPFARPAGTTELSVATSLLPPPMAATPLPPPLPPPTMRPGMRSVPPIHPPPRLAGAPPTPRLPYPAPPPRRASEPAPAYDGGDPAEAFDRAHLPLPSAPPPSGIRRQVPPPAVSQPIPLRRVVPRTAPFR